MTISREMIASRKWSARERIEAAITRIPESTCWYWIGAVSGDGYGTINFRNKQLRAHRLSYEAFSGPIPRGLVVDHLCRQPLCVNPAHLEAVSVRENTIRGISHNGSKTSCKRGHPLVEENVYRRARGQRECRTCFRERKAA